MSLEFKIGNTNGQYFTQHRFDRLMDLAKEVNYYVAINNALLDYDQNEDFHYLKFDSNGHYVSIGFYKVFSAIIDDKKHWIGCPESSMSEFIRSIIKIINQPK